MTTEDEFQAMLDKYPEDANTRLVFADWLQERDDPRAEGYRALGVLGRYPCSWDRSGVFWWFNPIYDPCDGGTISLERDWFDLVSIAGKNEFFAPAYSLRKKCSRREAEDAAAIAFSRLPAARRAELLAGVAV